MRKLITLILAIPIIAATAQTPTTQHHCLRVGDFTRIQVKDAINVIYTSSTDSAGLAVFDAPATMVNTVMFSCNGKGYLTITVDADQANGQQLPTIHIYSSRLDKAENTTDSTLKIIAPHCDKKLEVKQVGNGNISVTGINTDEFAANTLTGRGQIAAQGTCRRASLSCTGKGTIQADRLQAQFVTATVNGPVTIGCSASDALTVQGTGPGTVYYLGTPMIKNRSISGKYAPL